MPHSQSKPWADYRADCEQQPDEELAGRMSDYGRSESKMQIARVVYETRQMRRQHEYVKEQIELQHKRNTELTEKQGRWIKWSAVLTAVSTLTAAIAGSLVTYMLTRPLPQQTPRTDRQEITQSRIVPSTSASHSENTPDKAPSSPPK